MSLVAKRSLKEILGYVDFPVLVKLEKLRIQKYEKVSFKREEGYEVSLSRRTENGELLVNEIFIRRSFYAYGVVELFRAYYGELDAYIRSISYQKLAIRWRGFSFIKTPTGKTMLNGVEVYTFPQEEETLLAFISSLRNGTYFKLDHWLITPEKATYKNLLVDRVLLYLFLEK